MCTRSEDPGQKSAHHEGTAAMAWLQEFMEQVVSVRSNPPRMGGEIRARRITEPTTEPEIPAALTRPAGVTRAFFGSIANVV
jgi:hypothetical protein